MNHKMIYVCSPLRGDYHKNIEMAKEYSAYVANLGHLPMTPHLYFTQFLDDTDPSQRKVGQNMGIELLKRCDELWIFGNTITEGMDAEIRAWNKAAVFICWDCKTRRLGIPPTLHRCPKDKTWHEEQKNQSINS